MASIGFLNHGGPILCVGSLDEWGTDEETDTTGDDEFPTI